jgi:hypothetical protein
VALLVAERDYRGVAALFGDLMLLPPEVMPGPAGGFGSNWFISCTPRGGPY